MKRTRTYERKAILIPKFRSIDNNLILVCCLYKYKDTIKVLRNREEIINTITEFSKDGDEKYKPVLCITHLDKFFKLVDLPIESRFPLEGNSIIEAVTDSGVIIRDATKLGIDTDSSSWLLNEKLHSESEIPDNIMSELLEELDYAYRFVSKIKAHGFTINANANRAIHSFTSNLFKKYKSVKSFDNIYKEMDIKRKLNKQGYEPVKDASKGGLIFVNENYIDKILTDVHSFDITSAYPYVMFAKKMYNSDPICRQWSPNKNKESNIISFDLIDAIPKMMGIDPYNVRECWGNKSFTLPYIEFENALKFYNYSDIRFNSVCEFWRYDYFPFPIRHAILYYFTKKEESRGKGAEYSYNKLLYNNFYGACCKDPCKHAPSIEEGLKYYNANITHSRFKYANGASVTGHVRNIMLEIAYKLGNDFVCCHTDSIKFLNYEKNKHIFEEYNEKVRKELEEIRDNFTIPLDGCSEEGKKEREAYIQYFKDTVDKVLSFKNVLGTFKYEGCFKKFKMLGKNKYIADDNITFSGIGGKALYDYLKSLGDVYEEFNYNLKIPYKYSGRKDIIEVEPFTIKVKDKYGKERVETVRFKLAADWCKSMEINDILNHIS